LTAIEPFETTVTAGRAGEHGVGDMAGETWRRILNTIEAREGAGRWGRMQ